jgi:hypothetical protein
MGKAKTRGGRRRRRRRRRRVTDQGHQVGDPTPRRALRVSRIKGEKKRKETKRKEKKDRELRSGVFLLSA